MDKRLFLLDAFALIFRAYYALVRSPRITSTGKNTNAQFGFLNALLDLMHNQKATHLAVCFDTHAPTERHTDFADYKANRQETPEDILAAVPDIKKMLQGFNIPIVEVDGFEADDVIGTLSVQAANAGYDVFMVTPDKDYGQLVNDNVFIYKPANGQNKAEILGVKEVCEKWDIDNVAQVIDILGMMGDAVDNIPGIKGVGEKTAVKLLKEYGSLENVLANADQIKGAIGEKIRAGKDAAIMSKKLATIILNVPCTFHEEDFLLSEWNKDILREIFAELEFKTIGKRILGEEISTATQQQTDLFGEAVATKPSRTSAPSEPDLFSQVPLEAYKTINDTPHHYQLLDTTEKQASFLAQALQQKEICFDTETTGLEANLCELVGMSFSGEATTGYYWPLPP